MGDAPRAGAGQCAGSTALGARPGRAGPRPAALCGTVWYFWFLRGAFSEGRQWLTAARATSRGTDRAVRATALIGAGFLQFMQADATPANERFHEGLALGHALGDPFTIAYALLGLGSVAFNQGRGRTST